MRDKEELDCPAQRHRGLGVLRVGGRVVGPLSHTDEDEARRNALGGQGRGERKWITIDSRRSRPGADLPRGKIDTPLRNWSNRKNGRAGEAGSDSSISVVTVW